MSECNLPGCSFESVLNNKCICHCEKDNYILKEGEKVSFKNQIFSLIKTEEGRVQKLENIQFYENFYLPSLLENNTTFKFINCTFYKLKEVNDKSNYTIEFSSCIFNDKWYHFMYGYIKYNNCQFNKKILFKNNSSSTKTINSFRAIKCYFKKDFLLRNLNSPCIILNDSTFHQNLKIEGCQVEDFQLISSKLKDLCTFNKTTFTSAIFKNTSFDSLVDFQEANFTKKLDLEGCFFKGKSNFLKINSNIENRETARIIKDSFEKNNNIIEANKYYKLEMEQYEQELNKKLLEEQKEKETQNYSDLFKELLILKFHQFSSNHSTSWNLAFTWIVLIGFLHFLLKYWCNLSGEELIFSSLIIFFSSIMNLKSDNFITTVFISLFAFTTMRFIDINGVHGTDLFATLINPFSIMTNNENLTFIDLIFKTIYAYLIYQFIISVRQNTRRK